MKRINLSNIVEVKVSYRPAIPMSKRPKITSSEDAYVVFCYNWDENTLQLYESFKVMLLNKDMRVLGIYAVSNGGIDSAEVDIRLLMAVALKAVAVSIVVCHNHPSGALVPSKADLIMTQSIKEACEFNRISFLDHIIITSKGYLSFADEGLMTKNGTTFFDPDSSFELE